jgi:hypothetical protein
MGIEPTSEAWEASILPLYDARSFQAACALATQQLYTSAPARRLAFLRRSLSQRSPRNLIALRSPRATLIFKLWIFGGDGISDGANYSEARGTLADTATSAKTSGHSNINLAGGAGSRSRPLNKTFSCVERQHGCKNNQCYRGKKSGEEEPAA